MVKDSDSVPFILVGTKIHKRNTRVQILEPGKKGSMEVEQSSVTFNNGLKMASDIKAQGFFECSAKTRVSYSGLCREKTYLWGFRPCPTQTGLYHHRIWLEA